MEKKYIVGTDYGFYPEVKEFDNLKEAEKCFRKWKKPDLFGEANVYLAEVILKHNEEKED